MNSKHFGYALLLIPLLVFQAFTTEPDATLPPVPIENVAVMQSAGKEQPKPGDKSKDKQKDKDKKPPEKKLTDAPDTDIFTQTPAPLRDALGFNPHMMGDFYGTFARSTVTITGTQTICTQTALENRGLAGGPCTITTNQVTEQRTFLIPLAGRGGFKIAENASPMPVDRWFFTYNHFNSIRTPQYGQTAPSGSTQNFMTKDRTGITKTSIATVFPAPIVPFVNANREIAGFEKTFLDGRASFEMRLPVFQQTGGGDDFRAANFGDITIIGKYAMYLDRETGDVFSGGLAVTAPTGPAINTVQGPVNSTLLQPWIGYIVNFDGFYLHAFHSAVVPTDSRDVMLLFNDLGLGYWLFRGDGDRILSFIVPTLELHVTTPLNNRSDDAPITCPDLVVVTAGAHLGIFRNSVLSLGVGTPISGPYTYGVEAFVQFNRRY